LAREYAILEPWPSGDPHIHGHTENEKIAKVYRERHMPRQQIVWRDVGEWHLEVELHAKDWFTITGRGRVASFEGIEGFDPRLLLNTEVTIDGKPYFIRGVETFAILDATGRSFGLLVRDV
jgi:hypothetical protein